MTAEVVRGDARRLSLADESVDLIVTSPPYWSLRSYTDGGEHYDGQIGAEPTPAAYVDSLIECTREWLRVLKPTGSLWVNLGDKYNAYNGNRGPGTIQGNDVRQSAPKGHGLDAKTVPAKSLIGLPWRYAIRCVDDLGLILRAEVIWSKPNGLPESVTDRVRRSHETWFHFVRSPRYFSAVDTIREAHLHGGRGMSYDARRAEASWHLTPDGRRQDATRGAAWADRAAGDNSKAGNPLGKLPGSVWEIATQPLKVPAELGVDHFAAFPMEWPRRIIQGWSPSGICTACGEGRRPVVASQRTLDGAPVELGAWKRGGVQQETTGVGNYRYGTERQLTGEACACPDVSAPTRPAVVLDPFGGTGTTALVAHALGRHGISVDMSADYCRLAQWRTTDPGQIAAALEVEKPVKQVAGQLGLDEMTP